MGDKNEKKGKKNKGKGNSKGERIDNKAPQKDCE